jgi:hypothetical protein
MKKTVILLVGVLIMCITAVVICCIYLATRKAIVTEHQICIQVGDTYDLNISDIFLDSECRWISGDTSIASVDENGTVIGKTIGNTMVSCIVVRNKKEATLKFRITVSQEGNSNTS